MPLTKPAISQRRLEAKERELINEFLRKFFTGTPHNDDAGQPVTFPACSIEFNQTDVHSLSNPLIHWNIVNRNSNEQPGEDGMNIHTVTLSNVYVQTTSGGTQNAGDHLCGDVADDLRELLDGKETLQLAAKGVQKIRVMRGPVPMNLPGLHTRLLVVKSIFDYEIPRR